MTVWQPTSISCLLAKDFINIYMTRAQREEELWFVFRWQWDSRPALQTFCVYELVFLERFRAWKRTLVMFPVTCRADISVSRTSAISRYLSMNLFVVWNKNDHLLQDKSFDKIMIWQCFGALEAAGCTYQSFHHFGPDVVSQRPYIKIKRLPGFMAFFIAANLCNYNI